MKRLVIVMSVIVIFQIIMSGMHAAEIRVPDHYPSIRDAVNASEDGDVVLVADGVYAGPDNTGIVVSNISIISENGPQSCTIDCNGTSYAFDLFSDEDKEVIVSGFTVIQAYDEWPFNGAINCSDHHVFVNNCILKNSPNLAGIANFGEDVRITNCLIHSNESSGFISTLATAELVNCTITDNGMYGAYVVDYSDARFTNCIITNNEAYDVVDNLGSHVTFTTTQTGVDPSFVTGPLGDYYLSHLASGQSVNSSALDAGNDDAMAICFRHHNRNICLDQMTTRTDLVTDQGTVDIGFHYMPVQGPQQPEYGVELLLNNDLFEAGDGFSLGAYSNAPPDQIESDLYVVLDVFGYLYFWPHWDDTPQSRTITMTPGQPTFQNIIEFTWPNGNFGELQGLKFWGGICQPDTGNLIGEIDWVTFGFK